MLYFLDCEFNGFGGELISLALSGEAAELYLARPDAELERMVPHPWVEEHVLPFLSLADARPGAEAGHRPLVGVRLGSGSLKCSALTRARRLIDVETHQQVYDWCLIA